MDTFVDSSWYFMRYCDPKNDQAMVAEGADYWMPMDQYIGGIEHAILHLLYARFWTKVMRDLGLVKIDEPFTKLLTQGMVLNEASSRATRRAASTTSGRTSSTSCATSRAKVITGGTTADGQPVEYGGWTKMSKSKNNGVDPQDLIEKYGADTARLYTMFTAPPEATLEWNDAARRRQLPLPAPRVELRRQAQAGIGPGAGRPGFRQGRAGAAPRGPHRAAPGRLRLPAHAIQHRGVGRDEAAQRAGRLQARRQQGRRGRAARGLRHPAALLYPATPHIAQQLWNELGYDKDLGGLLDAAWPAVDVDALVQDEIELMLQVNGKLRGKLLVPAGASKDEIEKLALACDDFVAFAEGAPPKRVIVVPGRLVNVVL
jgi:leucyl-tRNA synthetase